MLVLRLLALAFVVSQVSGVCTVKKLLGCFVDTPDPNRVMKVQWSFRVLFFFFSRPVFPFFFACNFTYQSTIAV